MKKIKSLPVILSLPKSILGVSILFVLALSTGCDNDKKDVSESETTVVSTVTGNDTAVSSYISFIANDSNKMSLDHAYTNDALLKLTSAISVIAGKVGFDVKSDLETAKECANNITKNPFETSHADEIRKAAEILSGVLQNIQAAKYPDLSMEAGEVNSAALAINPTTLTLDQKDAVKTFFSKSANLLDKMNK